MKKYGLNLCNYYGEVEFYQKDGKYFMELDNYNRSDILEIPEYLYEALLKFHNENNLK